MDEEYVYNGGIIWVRKPEVSQYKPELGETCYMTLWPNGQVFQLNLTEVPWQTLVDLADAIISHEIDRQAASENP